RDRMRHGYVRDAALAEERALPLEGAIDELIDQHEGAGGQLLLERSAGPQRYQVGHARALEHVDIGAVVDVGRRQPVALVVARQKHDRRAGNLADAQRRRGLAPWALDLPLPHLLQPRQVVDAGAADDAEHGLGHFFPISYPRISAPALSCFALVLQLIPPNVRWSVTEARTCPIPASSIRVFARHSAAWPSWGGCRRTRRRSILTSRLPPS